MRTAWKRVILTGMVSGLLLVGSVASGSGKPVRNVSKDRHPNLSEAQKLCSQAYKKVLAAQLSNEWDLGGHAERAKTLLEQASDEIKLAAEAANQNKK